VRAPRNDRCVLYVIECQSFHKVGISTRIKNRLAGLQGANPFPIRLATFRNNPQEHRLVIEKAVHSRLTAHHVRGEWYSADLPTIRRAIIDGFREARGLCGSWDAYGADSKVVRAARFRE